MLRKYRKYIGFGMMTPARVTRARRKSGHDVLDRRPDVRALRSVDLADRVARTLVAARSVLTLAPRAASALRESWDELVRLFATSGFGVSLLAVWGVLTLIGVVIDQGKDAATYAAAYGPPGARMIERLDLGNIYHSAAYIGVLGLILCSMAAATFTRVIPRRIPRLAPVKIDAIPLHASVRVDSTPDEVRARIARVLRRTRLAKPQA